VKNRVRTATILFVIAQLVLAALLVLGILTEDGDPLNWLFVRQNFWSLLIATEVLAVCAGLWEGASGKTGRSRLIVYAIGPATLITVCVVGRTTGKAHPPFLRAWWSCPAPCWRSLCSRLRRSPS
jgi:hypothetical protein